MFSTDWVISIEPVPAAESRVVVLHTGARFGRYNLAEPLGQGGLAEVWRAVDLSNGRTVALKVFTPGAIDADAERVRADVELLAAHALDGHPNVVEVYSGGASPQPHVVMEYVDGGDLGRELALQGRLSVERTLQVGTAVASALDAAARAGITHGDLKPSNILLGSDASIKLADFNVARVVGYRGGSVPGSLLLSFAYAAPEVWDGQITGKSDLYALGCVLYQCLTGRTPFTGSYAELVRGHIERAPDLDALPSETPPGLRSLIGDLLAKDPALRPTDAGVVLVRLAAMSGDVNATVSARFPRAFGPWLIESDHPDTPYAWLGRHQQSGKQATLQLFFGDQALGEQLQRAVAVNDQLVPYGAERLLDANRLLLRPDESLGRPAPSGWMFWVARDEQQVPVLTAPLTAVALANAADRIRRLIGAAATVRLQLDLSQANLSILPSGEIYVRRPGLVPATDNPEPIALATLAAVAPPALAPVIASAASLADASGGLRAAGTRTVPWAGSGDRTVVQPRGGPPAATAPVIAGAAGAATSRGSAAPPEVGVAQGYRPRAPRAMPAGRASDGRRWLPAILTALLALMVFAVIAAVLLSAPRGPAATFPVIAIQPTRSPAPTLTPAPTPALTPSPSPVPTLPPPTAPPPTPLPPPPTPLPPPPIAWSVSIAAAPTTALNGQLATLTATASQDVAGTGSVIQIFNPDTGFVHQQCSSGTVCTIGGRRDNTTVRYAARIVGGDGTVEARSDTVTVTWAAPPPTPTPSPPPPAAASWTISLNASPSTAPSGQLITMTARTSRDVAGSGYVIQIFNPDTGFIHNQCTSGTVCSIGGRRTNATVRFQARVSAPDGGNVQAQSDPVTVTWY